MANFQLQARRLLVAGGFAVAVVAAPGVAAFTADPGHDRWVPVACPAGEEADHFTGACVPHTAPNTPGLEAPYGGIPGNPDLPAVAIPGGGGAIPCTGENTGECIGLAMEGEATAPHVTPESHVGSSPTVHGHIGP